MGKNQLLTSYISLHELFADHQLEGIPILGAAFASLSDWLPQHDRLLHQAGKERLSRRKRLNSFLMVITRLSQAHTEKSMF